MLNSCLLILCSEKQLHSAYAVLCCTTITSYTQSWGRWERYSRFESSRLMTNCHSWP